MSSITEFRTVVTTPPRRPLEPANGGVPDGHGAREPRRPQRLVRLGDAAAVIALAVAFAAFGAGEYRFAGVLIAVAIVVKLCALGYQRWCAALPDRTARPRLGG